MNITFLIGNGFDLNLGMKTAYNDIYPKYIKTDSATENIAKFKKMLEAEEACNYKTWADFEMGMANHIDIFDSENDFIECVRDFKQFLGQQLLFENDNCKTLLLSDTLPRSVCIKETKNTFENFYIGQTPNVVNHINDIIESHKQMKIGIDYNIISFNYTEVFDSIINETNLYYKNGFFHINPILHIHGSLDGAIILGVDNANQLQKAKFPISLRTKRTFIKPEFNAEHNIANLNNAKDIIEQSDIIYIFGMALGESDSIWVKAIIKWLINNPKHLLFYNFYNKPTFRKWEDDVVLDVQDEKREEFIKIISHNIDENIEIPLNQIHIPLTHSVFNYTESIKKATLEEMHNPKPMGSIKSPYSKI